jgi:hypothetical protein
LTHGPFGNNGDFAFNPRVDNKILTGNVGNTLNDCVNIGAFEIQSGTGRKTLQRNQQPQAAKPPQIALWSPSLFKQSPVQLC